MDEFEEQKLFSLRKRPKGECRSNPPFYRGTRATSHPLSKLLPKTLSRLAKRLEGRPDAVLAAWPEVIGPKLAPMTKALSFQEGILTVRVDHATLYSILSQQEKPKIIASMKRRFPNAKIKTIQFRFG